MKILITGITGFIGSHLADYILDNNLGNVYGIKRWRSPTQNIEHILNKVSLYDCDLTDLHSLIKVFEEVKADRIYHLAAQSYVPASYNYPAKTLEDNGLGTLNLLNAIRMTNQNPFIHICSSSEVYGQVEKNETPITENQPFRPASPYAVSKVAEDMYGWMYYVAYKMNIVRTRQFTTTGPRRGEVFVVSNFAKQLAEMEKGKHRWSYGYKIEVGNLDSVRTFLDVRDVVKAYWLLPECPAGEVYNIGGDTTMTVGDMLNKLIEISGLQGVKVIVDNDRLRPADVTMQIPSSEKFKKATNWKPTIPFEKTLADLLQYWRDRV